MVSYKDFSYCTYQPIILQYKQVKFRASSLMAKQMDLSIKEIWRTSATDCFTSCWIGEMSCFNPRLVRYKVHLANNSKDCVLNLNKKHPFEIHIK